MALDSSTSSEAPEGSSELLAIDSLTKRFGGVTAVDDLSFAVRDGEILGFIGPNGAGKTTTFNCVSGMLAPTAGRVYFRGEDITDLPAYRVVEKGIARTFQSFRLLPDRPVVDNVALALMSNRIFTLSGLRGRTKEEAVDICERVGLSDRLDRSPDNLTHEGLLRMELARALATDPAIVLLDEPFAGLAKREVEAISSLIESLRDDGITFVVIDHNMRGLLELVERVIVIHFGAKIAEGPPREITTDPRVQEAYLGDSGVE